MLLYSRKTLAQLRQLGAPLSSLIANKTLSRHKYASGTQYAFIAPDSSWFIGTSLRTLISFGKFYAATSVTLTVTVSNTKAYVKVGEDWTTVSSSGSVTCYKNSPIVLDAEPVQGYETLTTTLGGQSISVPYTTTLSSNSTFASSASAIPVITATVGEHGTLKLGSYTITTGSNSVPSGNYSWSATYDEGYELDTFTVDGEAVSIPSDIQLAQNHTVVFTTKASE